MLQLKRRRRLRRQRRRRIRAMSRKHKPKAKHIHRLSCRQSHDAFNRSLPFTNTIAYAIEHLCVLVFFPLISFSAGTYVCAQWALGRHWLMYEKFILALQHSKSNRMIENSYIKTTSEYVAQTQIQYFYRDVREWRGGRAHTWRRYQTNWKC